MTINFVVEYFILDIFWNKGQSLIYHINPYPANVENRVSS